MHKSTIRLTDVLSDFLADVIKQLVVEIVAGLLYKGLKKGVSLVIPSLRKLRNQSLFYVLLIAFLLRIISFERWLLSTFRLAHILGYHKLLEDTRKRLREYFES